MKEITSPQALQAIVNRCRRQKKTIGFVPTMGALHRGHLSLVAKAREENDIVLVSIFVNPFQFGPREDLKKYPKPIAQDRKLLKKNKVDILFRPNVSVMTSPESLTRVTLHSFGGKSMADRLCGAFRPGHFEGVLTIVAKLFLCAMPDRAYFGQKDYQQGRLIEQMIKDLNFNIELRMLPIVRDLDGLALSSRNQFLNKKQRDRAVALPRVLKTMKKNLQRSSKSLEVIRSQGRRSLVAYGLKVQYLEIVDPISLEKIRRKQSHMLVAVACFVGKTRLIDNVTIRRSSRKKAPK